MEYQINEFITLKLEEGKTNIYVNGKKFRTCKYLLLDISLDEIERLDHVESIDHASELLDHSLDRISERNRHDVIPPETEFWGHCSNIQAWVENDYDMRIIDSRLGFPFLGELKREGDPKAGKVFKEEIAKKFKQGWLPTIEYLWEVGYLENFTEEEVEVLKGEVRKAIIKTLEEESAHIQENKQDSKKIFKRVSVFKARSPQMKVLLSGGYLYLLDEEEKMRFEVVKELRETCLELLDAQRDFWSHSMEEWKKREKIEEEEKIRGNVWGKDSFNEIAKYLILMGYFGALTIDDIESHPKLQEVENLEMTRYETPYRLKAFPEAITHLKGLKSLKISKYNFTSVPESIGNLTELRTLDLSENKLNYLPENIGNLNNLEILKLQKNQLEVLPESIGHLSNLKELNLSSNKLINFPSQIANLSSLQRLEIESNGLKELSENILEMRSLESLNVSNNQLMVVPNSIGALKNLKHLYLHSNKLTDFPRQIYEIKTLQYLDLGLNFIETIPNIIGRLKDLISFKIGQNKLTELPESIGELLNLKWLDLYDNQIEKLPRSFIKLKNLEWIRIWNNDLKRNIPYGKRSLKIESIIDKLIQDGLLKRIK